MQIDSIVPVTKDRNRVILDTGESFVIYKGEQRILKLTENSELPEDTYNRIMTVILPKRAKLRAMNLLKVRPYTEYQLRRKLSEGGYPDTVSEIAIEYVKSFGYIDDKTYAVDFIKSQTDCRSKKELYLKLSQKGIQREVLDYAFNVTYGSYSDAHDECSFDETEVIIKALQKRHFTGNETYEERQKLLAYFYRRGFEMDNVFKAMDQLGGSK